MLNNWRTKRKPNGTFYIDTPEDRRELIKLDDSDALGPARGVVYGVIISVAMWQIIAFVWSW